MEDRERRDEDREALRFSERVLRPLAEDRPAPPEDLVERVRRRTRAFSLVRDSLELVTGACRRFVIDLLPRRTGRRCDRER